VKKIKIKNRRPLIGLNSGFHEYADYQPGDIHYKDRYQVFTRYMDAIAEVGGAPVMLPCFDDLDTLKACMEHFDGFVFTGGADYPPEMSGQMANASATLVQVPPRRAAVDLMLAKLALAREMPLLGICLGCQLVNIALGGQLIQHLDAAADHRSDKGDACHSVTLENDSWLHDIFGQENIMVNSAHHQAISPEFIGQGLRVVARAADGTIEAVQGIARKFVVGVQWHPERIKDVDHRRKLFGGFLRQCVS